MSSQEWYRVTLAQAASCLSPPLVARFKKLDELRTIAALPDGRGGEWMVMLPRALAARLAERWVVERDEIVLRRLARLD